MDLKEINKLIQIIAKERELPKEKVFETFEEALASAWKKECGKKGQKIVAKFDLNTGKMEFWRVFLVLDPSQIQKEGEEKVEGKVRFNPEKHLLLEEAKKINPQVKPGEEIRIPLEIPSSFGRIAAQTAKQVFLQKIKELEKEITYENFKQKEGDVAFGIVQKVDQKGVYFDLGKVTGFMPKGEQIPNEFYRIGQKLKVYLLKVEKTSKGVEIVLSRAHPKLVSRLFALEVPEIANGEIEIKSIAREPGLRTKIAVSAKKPGIDVIGACIGIRGTRVQAVISELGGEKIDIIEYSDDPQKFIANALSPAKVTEVKILPKNTALAVVPDDQLSLAIGKDGQNVRLAARLTNWKIDVKTVSEVEKEKEKELEGKEEKS